MWFEISNVEDSDFKNKYEWFVKKKKQKWKKNRL